MAALINGAMGLTSHQTMANSSREKGRKGNKKEEENNRKTVMKGESMTNKEPARVTKH